MYKNNLFILALVLGTIIVSSEACKTPVSKEYKLLQGKWDLILWNNVETEGNIYFKDSLMYFKMNNNMTEEAVFNINKDTITFRRIGGKTNIMSSGENWVIDKIRNNFFKLHNSFGTIVTAYKPELTSEAERSKPKE